jgi:uncharacterized protein YllA (UPF0747 family)
MTDHEAILLMRQDLYNLKESQCAFHKEVREAFEDLKNNYSLTLSNHEGRIKDLEAMKEQCKKDIENLQKYYQLVSGAGLFFLLLISGMIIYHLTGYKP